jgi:hypothetical protein
MVTFLQRYRKHLIARKHKNMDVAHKLRRQSLSQGCW